MLKLTHDNVVTRANHETRILAGIALLSLRGRIGEGVRHQVQSLRGILREDDLRRLSAHEFGDAGAGALIGIGGLFRQLMRAAVYCGVGVLVVGPLGVEYRPRLLRRSCAIQVDQWTIPTHGALQDRKVFADTRDVESHVSVPLPM